MAGLYIHIPFCKQACHYCDFHFSTNQSTRQELVSAIALELKLQKNYVNAESLQTIYFGGGTPSLLSAPELTTIFDAIHSNYPVADLPEITLEANPDDLSAEKLALLAASGINRLSIGIQSFDDDVLHFLNRAHTSGDAHRSMAAAGSAGFSNISIDLMYAIAGQSTDAWIKNIEQAIALSPEHISAYALTLEEKTAFGKWQRSGKLTAVDDDIAAEQFEILMEMLRKAGYEHYEISNFSLPGKNSRHNSNYWKQELYLGVGPSAHSYNGLSRQANVSHNIKYMSALRENKIPFEREVLSRENKINEYIFTTLRTSWGCDLDKLQNDFQYDVVKINEQYLKDLVEKKLVVIEDHHLKLTQTGKLLADKIASDLFAEPAM